MKPNNYTNEIKFRGRKKNGNHEFVYGYYWYNEFTDEHYIQTTSGDNTQYIDIEVDKETVGQSLCLFDTNKVEIFSGDELMAKNPNGEFIPHVLVKWNNAACTYTIEDDFGDFDITSIGWAMEMGYTFEVMQN